MTQYILITPRKAELELCDCPKTDALTQFRIALDCVELSETTLEDLSAKVEGAVLIQDAKGCIKHLESNSNLYPYFFVGNVLLAKKTSEGYETLTASDIDHFFEWLHGLEDVNA